MKSYLMNPKYMFIIYDFCVDDINMQPRLIFKGGYYYRTRLYKAVQRYYGTKEIMICDIVEAITSDPEVFNFTVRIFGNHGKCRTEILTVARVRNY